MIILSCNFLIVLIKKISLYFLIILINLIYWYWINKILIMKELILLILFLIIIFLSKFKFWNIKLNCWSFFYLNLFLRWIIKT